MTARKTFLLAILALLPMHKALAQSVADLWISMPAAATPYLTLNQKKEMVECHKIGVDTSVINLLQGTTLIDTLTADYGRFRLSSSHDFQMILLPCEPDTIVCTIDSYSAPAVRSRISFYDKGWNPLRTEDFMPAIRTEDLTERPDTMSVEEYGELCSLIYPELVAADYDLPQKRLLVSLSAPLVTSDEKERLEAIMSKKMLIWSGERFNICYK